LTPELPFSAHPRRDVTTGELFNFGVLPDPGPADRASDHRPRGRDLPHPSLGPRIAELPRVAPDGDGPRRYIFGLGAPPSGRAPFLTCIQRLDTQTGADVVQECHPDLPGESIPVPRGSDEAAWVLTLVYRAAARRTDLVMLRGADLGLQAVLPLPHAIPPGFHGTWVEAAGLGGS
jgi:carotenoid cleavage dioxygenase-like enzyme